MILLLALLLQTAPEPPLGFPGHAGETWGIDGNKFYFQGRYAEALERYRDGEKKDRGGFCGNCMLEKRAEYQLAQAVCLERLGRTDEAVPLWIRYGGGWSTVHLADLYEAAGQQDDFKALADQMDEATLRSHKGDRTKLKDSPGRELRRVLEIRDLEKAEKWSDLIELLSEFETPREEANRRYRWSAMEASRLLARHPAEAAPLLLKAFQSGGPGTNAWIPYALARCETPQGIAAIRTRLSKEDNIHVCLSLVYALSQGGESGKTALLELAESAKGNLKLALDDWASGRMGRSTLEMTVPAQPPSIKLPTRYTP